MITVSGDKISANQSLKPNDYTENLSKSDVTITFLGETLASSTKSFILEDPFVDEITFNIKITQWNNLGTSQQLAAQTFKWKNLQESVVLYEDAQEKYELSATCQMNNTQLKITYFITANVASMESLTFKFESNTTVRGAKMVDDLSFQDGFMKISSIIDYQEKVSLGASQSYTFPHNCIAMVRRRSGSSGGYSDWTATFDTYVKGTKVSATSQQMVEIYKYLIFKNPED